MKLIRKHSHGEVTGFELGYSPMGKPFMTARFYLVDGVMIDTGIPHLRREVISLIRAFPPRKVLLTHHHEDHSGNCAAIKKALGVEIFGHPLAIRKMTGPLSILPYQHLVWGQAESANLLPLPDVIETHRFRFTPIHTPGHSKDHVAYLEKNEGWLFSGDLYLGDRIKIFRQDENIHDEINSIGTILTHDFDVLFCGHNPRYEKGKEALRAKLDFLEAIVEKATSLKAEGMPVPRIISAMQTSSDRFIRYFTMGNVSYGHMIRSALVDRPTPKKE